MRPGEAKRRLVGALLGAGLPATAATAATPATDGRAASARQALLRDPYLALKRPPLARYAMVVLPEKPVNGGLWYARASGRGRGAHWVMEEARAAG